MPSLRSRRSIRKREEKTLPAALSIGAAQNWDGNDGPWSSFPVQIGVQPQTVRVLPGTSATSVFTVSPAACPDYYPENCPQQRGNTFDVSKSNTWTPNSIYNVGIEQNLGLDTDGTAGYDSVTIGWPGAVQAKADHNVVFNLESPNFWVGMFGLNPRPTNFTTAASITEFNNGQVSFMQSLVNNRTIPSLSWGYTAGNQYRLNGNNLGSLTLGGYDASRFNAAQTLSLPFNSDISRDLLLNLRSISTDSSASSLLPDGNIQIFLDSSVSQLWLPQSACDAFAQAFNLTYDESASFYLVNQTLRERLQAVNPNVTFTLAADDTATSRAIEIVFPYAAFDLTLEFPNIMDPNSSAYFPLKIANNATQYTLGRTFFQEAYVFADYDRQNFTVAPCDWNASRIAQQEIKSIIRANETSSGDGGSSSNTGAIAGGVVGGVVAIVAIAGLILFFMRRKKKAENQRIAELDAKSAAGGTAGSTPEDKSCASDAEARPIISGPMGGELEGQEIHQLDSPHKIDPNKIGYSEMENPHEFYSPVKGVPAEMRGQTPIYEMAGSDVGELPAPRVNMTESK
ncbi:hypothetical protein CERZMDRAFT_66028 [Cercospora zeae-maydis SCOH1-5]|uniref:Peptidase A1 domain-containing protein n=1 Tax=Cercospora zeae-maydis SCOH1-5 TaxID=717836 RepID=A0A6A6FMX9_9PEZI|nr:hypothetical protein CERZMDRAFT_66028 [Cercospora zeae-maydis SCOH1-5]